MGEEKIAIARQYLIPTSTKESGVTADQIEITDNALLTLIKSYCRESGVRNLQKHIEKVHTTELTDHDVVYSFSFYDFLVDR